MHFSDEEIYQLIILIGNKKISELSERQIAIMDKLEEWSEIALLDREEDNDIYDPRCPH